MLNFFVFILFSLSFVQAQVGEVLSLKGGLDAHLLRRGKEIALSETLPLELGDKIITRETQVSLLIYPKIQMSLSKGSEIVLATSVIEEAGNKATSLVNILKGLVRILVTKEAGETVEQSVDAGDVTFAVRGTEYEVSVTAEDAELDVVEGEVEVSSPLVQTFVPEIVKRGEGFQFQRKTKQFSRRAFRQRLKEARFLRKEELKERLAKRRLQRAERKALRRERKNNRGSKGP